MSIYDGAKAFNVSGMVENLYIDTKIIYIAQI